MFLTASSTPSLREKKIWQNAQTLWPHIYITNEEFRRLWHDIPRFFVHFLEKQIFLLKHRKCKVCLPFQLLEIETGWQSNCFSYSTSGWASDCLVGVCLRAKNSKLIHLSKCTCINCLKTLRSILYFFLKILFFYRVKKHAPLTIMPRFPLVYVNKTIVRNETFSISIFCNYYYFYLH